MSALERHYSINEIAELWGFAPGVVRRIFAARSDVIRIGHAEKIRKRQYITIRVPESVLAKVYNELKKKI